MFTKVRIDEAHGLSPRLVSKVSHCLGSPLNKELFMLYSKQISSEPDFIFVLLQTIKNKHKIKAEKQ
jgi:hypothetical protein